MRQTSTPSGRLVTVGDYIQLSYPLCLPDEIPKFPWRGQYSQRGAESLPLNSSRLKSSMRKSGGAVTMFSTSSKFEYQETFSYLCGNTGIKCCTLLINYLHILGRLFLLCNVYMLDNCHFQDKLLSSTIIIMTTIWFTFFEHSVQYYLWLPVRQRTYQFVIAPNLQKIGLPLIVTYQSVANT